MHQLVEHLDVVDEVPDFLFTHGDLGLPQLVEVPGTGGLQRSVLGAAGGTGDDGRVGGQFHEQVDAVAGGGALGVQHAAVVGVQALDRGAVGVVDQALGLAAGSLGEVEAEVEDCLDAASGPLLGDLRARPQPCGRPGAAPAGSEGEGLVVGVQRLGHRDGFALDLPGAEDERAGGAVEGGADHPVQQLADPGLGDPEVVMHRGGPSRGCARGRVRAGGWCPGCRRAR